MDNLERDQRLALRIAGVFAVLAFVVALPLILNAGAGAEDFLIAPRESFVWSDAVHSYFTAPDPEAVHYWRPATRVVQQTLQVIFGTNLSVFHTWNVILHILATLFFFLLAKRLSGSATVAGFAAIIFLIHPGHEEPVIWISGISGLSESVCHLGGLIAFDCFLDDGRRRWGVTAVMVFAMAVLFKESGTTMLITFPLIWWFRRHDWHRVWPMVGMLIVVAFMAFWRAAIGVNSSMPLDNMTLSPLGPLRNVLFYVAQSVAPIRSIFRMVGFDSFYRVRDALPTIPTTLPYILAVLTLAASSIAVVLYTWKRWPAYSRWCLFLAPATLGPLLLSRYTGMRLMYLFAGFLGLCIVGLIFRANRKAMLFVLVGWIIMLSASWVERAEAWRESGQLAESVFQDALRIAGDFGPGSTVVFRGVPARHLGGFVFPVAFSQALMERLGSNSPRVYNYDDGHEDLSSLPATADWFTWNGTSFARSNSPKN